MRTSVLAALALLAATAAHASDEYCASFWENPDERYVSSSPCTPAVPRSVVASGIAYTLGGAWTTGLSTANPFTNITCRGVETPATDLAFRQEVGLGTRAIKATRWEIATFPIASIPGFDCDWALDTATAWATVTGFFTADASANCGGVPGTCTWSDSYLGNATTNPVGQRLRDYCDASTSANTYQSKVYYLRRSSSSTPVTVGAPNALEMDLTDPAYRAWRISVEQADMAAGGYAMTDLNQKFFQYEDGNTHWLGGAADGGYCGNTGAPVTTVTEWNDRGDTLFSAQPSGYGFPEYVQGWHDLGEELHAAGIPFAVTIDTSFWTEGCWDDSGTAGVDERELIQEVVENWASLVILNRSGFGGKRHSRKIADDLRARGREVVEVDVDCGTYGRSIVWGRPDRPYVAPVNTAPGPNR